MSKITICGGDIIEKIGGKDLSFAKGEIINNGSSVIQTGKENGVTYGESKELPKYANGIISIAKVLVGKAKRSPGHNYDGTIAEDMLYNDKPAKSASILNDPVNKLDDATLGKYLNQLMTSLSIGEMETVALEMSLRFQKGIGGVYKSNILNSQIANHNAFVNYHNEFLENFRGKLREKNFDPSQLEPIPMKLLNFSSFWDKVSGLGITVHQVWSIKAELINYTYNKCTKVWTANLLYTLYDHFGLDWDDIVKHGNDRIPQYHTGDFFKAWYILQHYRGARPFITEMTRTVFIAGHTNL